MPILILRTGAALGRPEHHRKSPIEIALPTRHCGQYREAASAIAQSLQHSRKSSPLPEGNLINKRSKRRLAPCRMLRTPSDVSPGVPELARSF
jgi:hypothetical protein